MKDGVYALRFSADGYLSEGTLDLQRNHGRGHDGAFRIEGNLIEKQNRLSAIFNVLMPPRSTGNARLPEHYSLNMTGTSSDDAFTLIGTGPLGIIVDIVGQWARPLDSEET